MRKSFFAQFRRSFLAGLAVVLPAVLSIGLLVWLFRTGSNFTDTLLLFVPREWTHKGGGTGPMHWYWSLFAFMLAIALVTGVGVLARYYIGKKVIEWVDRGLLRVPLLNKIYGATKQVNEAFSDRTSSFRSVVLVEYPRPGSHALGFITNEAEDEIQAKSKEKLVCVYVPTAPNPLAGFMLLLPESQVTKLEMSVADGIKYVISLGSIAPEHEAPKKGKRS